MFGPMDASPPATTLEPRLALRWQWSRLPQLAAAELYAALAARQQVFAVEQRCAFQDADGYDFEAWHLLGWGGKATPNTLAAYLRVLDPGTKYGEPSMGRVLTVPPFRGIGLGRVLMTEGIARCVTTWPGQAIRIAAQQRLEAFYSSLAFRAASAAYIEDGIAHVDMLRDAV
jgi:ElaA protein